MIKLPFNFVLKLDDKFSSSLIFPSPLIEDRDSIRFLGNRIVFFEIKQIDTIQAVASLEGLE